MEVGEIKGGFAILAADCAIRGVVGMKSNLVQILEKRNVGFREATV